MTFYQNRVAFIERIFLHFWFAPNTCDRKIEIQSITSIVSGVTRTSGPRSCFVSVCKFSRQTAIHYRTIARRVLRKITILFRIAIQITYRIPIPSSFGIFNFKIFARNKLNFKSKKSKLNFEIIYLAITAPRLSTKIMSDE